MAKMRDLRHTLIQYLMQRNRFGAGKKKKIEREGDERSNGGGMPLLAVLRLAMRIDPLAIIRVISEFVTVNHGPAVTFAFPGPRLGAFRNPVIHLNLIPVWDVSTLNWCEQNVLREAMSEDQLFGKIAEHDMTAVNFSIRFSNWMGEVDRGHHRKYRNSGTHVLTARKMAR